MNLGLASFLERGGRFLNFKLIVGAGPAWANYFFCIIVLHSTFFWAGLYSHIFHLKWAGLYQHIFHMKWAGLYQHIFHLKWAGFDKHFVYSRWAGLHVTRTFFIKNGLYSTIRLFLSNWTGLIWLFLFVSGARNQRRHKVHGAGQLFKKIYEIPCIALVFDSEHKAKSSGRSRTKFDGICEARRIVPHWMQSSACLRADLVRVSASVSARYSEQIVRTVRRADGPRALTTGLPARLMQAVLPRAPASGLLLPRAPAAPASRCRSDGPWDCGVQRQQWSWWPAAVACAVQHSLTATGTDSRDDSDGRFLTVLSIYVGPGQQTITRRNLK